MLEQVSHNTKELGDLQHKIDDRHSTTIHDRETAVNTRDHQLKCKMGREELVGVRGCAVIVAIYF